jgi:hypothetical protein
MEAQDQEGALITGADAKIVGKGLVAGPKKLLTL